jgi:hypothetical protein
MVDVHSSERLGQSKGRDEQTSKEGGITLVAELEMEDEFPGVW